MNKIPAQLRFNQKIHDSPHSGLENGQATFLPRDKSRADQLK
jgi:hypothetical protein